MSELMTPIPFRRLMQWITTEYQREGSVFGVHRPYIAGHKTLPIFGETIETPFGPAAGPATQLAQNIIAGYFGGARFYARNRAVRNRNRIAQCQPSGDGRTVGNFIRNVDRVIESNARSRLR